MLRQRAVSPCRHLPHVKANALSAHTSDSRPPQDGASGAAESASVALVLFALRQIRRARTGEVLSAFLTSAGLVGIALVLSLFIRAPRSGSRTEIEG